MAIATQAPYWYGVAPRNALLPELDASVLLHAGPPLDGAPPAPVRNAAAQALLLDGRADTLGGAFALLDRGRVHLRPAQNHGVVTPLAQVVSATMPMLVVGDDRRRAYAPIAEGPPPALRFGATASGALERMRGWAALAPRLSAGLARKPIAVDPIIAAALAKGDECHSRTEAAGVALARDLDGVDDETRAAVGGNPGLALVLIMAASAWRLGLPDSPLRAIGGNGIAFGLRFTAGAGDWVTVPAEPPTGPRFPCKESAAALGAIGDSAVVDACGLGGQALRHAPGLLADWRGYLPGDAVERPQRIIAPSGQWIDPTRIAASGLAPIINLAILDRAGTDGLLGRGFYQPPATLFARGR